MMEQNTHNETLVDCRKEQAKCMFRKLRELWSDTVYPGKKKSKIGELHCEGGLNVVHTFDFNHHKTVQWR